MPRGVTRVLRGHLAPDLAAPAWLTHTVAVVCTAGFALAMFMVDATPICMAVPTSMLGGLAVGWPRRTIPWAPTIALVGTAHVLIVTGIGAALGHPPALSLVAAVACLAYAVAVGAAHRRYALAWCPRSVGDAVRVSIPAIAFSPIMLLGWWALDPSRELAGDAVTIMARSFIAMCVGLNTLFPVFFGSPAAARVGGKRTWLTFLLPSLGFLTLLVDWPHLPLSWIVALTPLVAALYLSQRATGMLVFLLCMAELAMPYPREAPGPLSWLPPVLFIDLLMAFIAQTAMIICIGRDRLGRLRADVAEAVTEEQERIDLLSTVYQSMSDGLVLTDGEGRVTMSNLAAARLLDQPVPDRVSAQWAEAAQLQVGDAQRIVSSAREATSALGRPPDADEGVDASVSRRREVIVPAAGGAGRRLCVTHLPLQVGGSALSLHLLTDVTAAHERQADLESFAGTVAHDLRGPLTALIGWLETAEDALDLGRGGDCDEAIGRALSATDRMCALIDEYLAFTVARDGALTLTDVPLRRVVDDIAALYQGHRSGVVFEVDTPHVIHADAALTRQLLLNLIGNSVKYARPHEEAFIRVRSVEEEVGWAQVDIADRGLGLQPGDEERIFEAFSRSAKDVDAATGVGLGLSLCATIVARHGGWIRAHTNEWGGATFTFTLPMAAP